MLLVFLSTISNSPIALLSPVVVTFFLIIILSTLRLDFWLSFFTGVIAAIEYTLIYVYLFGSTSKQISLLSENSTAIYVGWGLMFIVVGLAAGFVAEQIKIRVRKYFKLYQERNEIVNLFGQQVSHSIVDVLLKQKPNLSAGRKNVTIMFLDIREFTPYSEKNAPEVVVEYLNTLFAMMIEVVNRYNGIINQFLGDGFMATFGAPVAYGNDTLNCVNAAREISHRIDDAVKSGTVPSTKIGIGIHTGDAITGNIGTEIRRQYSITGNVVILASRIEQLNKKFNTQILLSGDVRKRAGLSDNMVEDMGLIKLKGRQQKTRIFKIV
jgi:adenylate cyclase